MKEVDKLFKQSLAYAGFVGKVQGLFHFVNETPLSIQHRNWLIG